MASRHALPTAAEEGFKNAAVYDAHRPSYPPEAIDAFLSALKVANYPESKIVEVASGTGKFTELLARRPERFLVKAVEPHDGMRGKLVEKDLPGVEVLAGKAEKMPVGDEWGDACIAAQSFHWFATPEALTEIERVLRPGAVFGMIWNIEDYNKPASWVVTTKWEQKLNGFITSFKDGNPRFRDESWKDVFAENLPYTPFQVIKNTITDHLPKFSLPLGEGKTLSQIAVLEGADLENAKKIVEDALNGDDVERNENGEIAVHGVTYYAWADRL
ncbi:hypothetical protein DL764_003378 [Monosporascus ibericus]|uniref:Methyltransferase type 11 domain-containing protein n=1 Tax=Monosporascus ibericus TaxID=155417 RepID=A0A4Q4THI5_9PEZI|nr:hypothetical protein DL764_003378 [Monosporascus ibericus]